jgi:hypothetical protein
MSSRNPSGVLGRRETTDDPERPISRRPRSRFPQQAARELVVRAVQALDAATADALYADALTGSAFSTLMLLAAPHLEVFVRCIFRGKG